MAMHTPFDSLGPLLFGWLTPQCMQDGGLAEALITQVSSSGMMTGAIVSCPATGPGAYYLSQHMQATASQGTAPSQVRRLGV